MDTLNQTFGHGSVYFGAADGATDYAPTRISCICMPDPNVEELNLARAGRLRPNPATKVYGTAGPALAASKPVSVKSGQPQHDPV